MGISGLLPLLKEIQVNGHISEFKGKRLAVDAYVWLHKGAFGCAEDLVKGKKTTKFVDYAMHRVRLLRYHGISPYVVFDGGPLPAKKGTEVSRAKSRAENLERARSMESQGRWREARDFYTKCVDITPEMAYQLIKALRAENVDYVVAPYEADAQLCFLEREGIVDGIITEDSDLLVFGCRQVVFKLDGNGHCVWIHRDNLATIRDFPMHGWTDDQFRRMAMLSGCDYLDSIPGIGLKTAHRLLRRFNTVEKLLQHVRMEGTLIVPPNYQVDFNQAELAFIHQRVYHPNKRRLVPLNDFPAGGLAADDEKWIGLDVEDAIAKGMALGDLHPETRLPIVDEWPDFKPVARSKPLAESSKSNLPAGRGPMDAFVIKGLNKSRSLPTPVGRPSSGPARLSDLQATKSASPILSRNHSATAAAPIKKSKFFSSFSRVKREVTPEVEPELKWEESESEDIESQPIAGPSRLRSTSPQTIRSPSPDICSVHDDDDDGSPARSVFSEGHFVSSPGAPNLSSPTCSTPGNGIPFTTPRKKDGRVREDTPPSPTGATVGEGSKSLVPASSGIMEVDEEFSVKVESQIPTPVATPSARSPQNQEISRINSKISWLVPGSSSPGDIGLEPETQYPQPRATLSRQKQQLSISSTTSSDTIEDQEELVTPSVIASGSSYKKRKRSRQEDEIEESDDEKEAKSKDNARTVGQGWRNRYSFGASSSSPNINGDTPKQVPSANKRTKSDPVPRRTHSADTAGQNDDENVTPRALPTKRLTMLPMSVQASRILAPRPVNVPIPSSLPSKRLKSTGSRPDDDTPLLDKYRAKAAVGSKEVIANKEIENSMIVPASSSPIGRTGSGSSGGSSGGSSELGEESNGGYSPLSTQPGGKTWSKLQQYRMRS
ncbi:hypothetical protein IAT40_007314 [Kwoniella sp. CBS 6097]